MGPALLLSTFLTFFAQTVQQPAAPAAAGNPAAVISTSLGDITVEPLQDRAPVSVANFLQDANDGYVNLADNRELDHRGFTPSDFGCAVFGRVVDGMDVVSKIGASRRGRPAAWTTCRWSLW